MNKAISIYILYIYWDHGWFNNKIIFVCTIEVLNYRGPLKLNYPSNFVWTVSPIWFFNQSLFSWLIDRLKESMKTNELPDNLKLKINNCLLISLFTCFHPVFLLVIQASPNWPMIIVTQFIKNWRVILSSKRIITW